MSTLVANKLTLFQKAVLGFGYTFIYLPMFILIFYSFNKSRIVTVWGGFSTQWYGRLWNDEPMMDAVVLSFKLAIASASTAIVLGTIAGLIMARFGRFRGQTLFIGMITAPLVMPEVIVGLSLLLLFVAMQQLTGFPSGRGFMTIWIAHSTFSCAYVAVIIAARLRDMDESIEEAAQDLGATPWHLFWVITLPIVSPAIIAGWLLSFTMSFDDLVISSFVSGPGATTLPMVVFSSVRLGVSPKINALATVMLIVVTVGVIIAGKIMFAQQRKRERELRMAFGVDG